MEGRKELVKFRRERPGVPHSSEGEGEKVRVYHSNEERGKVRVYRSSEGEGGK